MKKVLLLLADGFEVLEASAFIDVFGWNTEEGDKQATLYSCGFQKEVKSSFNQCFVVDYTIDKINTEHYDALAIPGGFENYGFYDSAYQPVFLNVIRSFEEQNKTIASICVGALPIAKSGILNNRNATTYSNPVRREALKSFGANVQNQPIVVDNNIITSWNPSTALEVAFLLLEKLTSKENSEKVKSLMGF